MSYLVTTTQQTGYGRTRTERLIFLDEGQAQIEAAARQAWLCQPAVSVSLTLAPDPASSL